MGFAAVAQPGPFLIYLIMQTLAYGFRKTWMMAFAPLVSDGPIIAVTLLVLTQMPAWMQRGLNLLGGIFILYLTVGAYRQWRAFGSLEDQPTPTGNRGILKAALINTLNPMPYIYWGLVTGPILIAGWKKSPTAGLTFLISFYAVMICGLVTILALFSTTRSLGNQVSRAMLGISVLALGGFGLFQLWHSFLP